MASNLNSLLNLMNKDLKCYKCNRTYRGEGFNGVCTEACFRKKIKEFKEEKVNPFLPKVDRPLLTKEQLRIKKSNQRWIEREEPLHSKSQRINGEKLNRACAWYSGDPVSKRFKAARG